MIQEFRIDPARDEANRLSYRERIGVGKGFKIGFEKGFQIGIQEGIQKEKNEFISNALRYNLPFDLIGKLADTTVEMVEFVKAKLELNVGAN